MNGWDLVDAVKLRWPHVRFILATGWGASIDPREARARGVEAVLANHITRWSSFEEPLSMYHRLRCAGPGLGCASLRAAVSRSYTAERRPVSARVSAIRMMAPIKATTMLPIKPTLLPGSSRLKRSRKRKRADDAQHDVAD